MSTEIDSRITPALHPQNVRALPEWDDETAAVLGQTETMFSEAYEALRGIWKAKEAAAKNPTLNEAAKLLQVDDFAARRIERVNKGFDAELGRLNRAVAHLDAELSQPVQSRASHPVAAEIRQYVRELSTGKRMTFIRQAIEAGDTLTSEAVLGGPAYLSGLDGSMAAVLLRTYHEKHNPAASKRLKALQAAKELVEQRGALAQAEAAKAVGFLTDPKTQRRYYPAEIRKARNAAELPFREA